MSERGNERIDELRRRLETISTDIDELGMDLLRDAVDNMATERPPDEKRLMAARRAVERAIRSLS